MSENHGNRAVSERLQMVERLDNSMIEIEIDEIDAVVVTAASNHRERHLPALQQFDAGIKERDLHQDVAVNEAAIEHGEHLLVWIARRGEREGIAFALSLSRCAD